MPLVDIQLVDGVFDADQRRKMIEDVTDTMIAIEGEAMRGVTWDRIKELASGEWGIGGEALTATDIKRMQGKAA